jgi:hypothetical protein
MTEILCDLIDGTIFPEYGPCDDGFVCCGMEDTDTDADCPPECNAGCADETCFMLNAPGEVICPVGWHCNVTCDAAGACSSGIDCTAALSCWVWCGEEATCAWFTCGDGPCTVDCASDDSCMGAVCEGAGGLCDVTCSGDLSCFEVDCFHGPCSFHCSGANSCGGIVVCSNEVEPCQITCDGSNTCGSLVECGPGPCDIDCVGPDSCNVESDPLDCSTSCACDVTCADDACQGDQLLCPAGCDVLPDGGCTSAIDGCDAC